MIRTKRFIKGLLHKVIGKSRGYIDTHDTKSRLKLLFELLINIIGTGIIITIIINYWNRDHLRFISYGLTSAIIMYYLKWFRKLIVAKTYNEIDKL